MTPKFGKTVIQVDLRRPEIKQYFRDQAKEANKSGLSEYIRDLLTEIYQTDASAKDGHSEAKK